MEKKNGAQSVQTIAGRKIVLSAGVGKTNIDEFVGEAPQFDDITMLILEYKAEKEARVQELLDYDEYLMKLEKYLIYIIILMEILYI